MMNKTIEEVKKLSEELRNQYQPGFEKVGNHIAYGVGKDPKSGETTIEFRLTNNKLKNTLPQTYKDVKVNIIVIGAVKAL